MPIDVVEFRVRRDDLRAIDVARTTLPEVPEAGTVHLVVDRFALTANNITYAAFGDRMKYWDFYPAPHGWGIVPVWGYADVIASAHGEVAVGERYYGYFPMASHVRLSPGKVSRLGFYEGSERRRALAEVYNTYLRTTADDAWSPKAEDVTALMRPLFFTSFLAADFLGDNSWYGAEQIVLSSASSKTAWGIAQQLRQVAGPRPRSIGLTAPGNRAFVEGLGLYDEVRSYGDVAGMTAAPRTVYVDMSGDATLRATIHRHFGDALAYSCSVGGTHWENLGGAALLPGPRPQLFFAPAQIKKRTQDWGPEELRRRMAQAWAGMLPTFARHIQVARSSGPEAVTAAYRAQLAGSVPASTGHILSLSGRA